MKKGFGVLLLALIAAAAGSIATIFALKKRDEWDGFDYELDDEEKFFEDCDCEDCACEDCGDDFDDLDDLQSELDEEVEEDLDEDLEELDELDGKDEQNKSSDF